MSQLLYTNKTTQCLFCEWVDEGDRPDCCTDHLKEMLFAIADLLEKQGIIHWIDFGTLLGAVRDEAFIPWDRDVDISIYLENESETDREMNRLEGAIVARGYHVVRSSSVAPDRLQVQYSKTNGLCVDIYLHHNRKGILQSLCGVRSNEWQFPVHFLDTMTEVSLYGRNFPAPSPVHDFLSDYRYGPTYLIPIQFGLLGMWLEPAEFTPWVADCFKEFKRLEEAIREAEAQLSEIPPHPTDIATTKCLDRSRWIKARLHALIRGEESIAMWVRMTFDIIPKQRRVHLNRLLWACLKYTNYLRHFADRNNLPEVDINELTPATYMLVNNIARKKARLAFLETEQRNQIKQL